MTANPRIFVAGCGAIGSAYGCLLGRVGHALQTSRADRIGVYHRWKSSCVSC